MAHLAISYLEINELNEIRACAALEVVERLSRMMLATFTKRINYENKKKPNR